MGPELFTYYLTNPESRPNPFRIGANVIFVDGVWTSYMEKATIEDADKMLAAYGATREVPAWAQAQTETGDGLGDHEQNGKTVGGGETPPEGQVPSDGETPAQEDDNGPEDAEGDAGDEGSGASETGGEGAADQPEQPAPVKPKRKPRKPKAEDDLA